jgi:hypothetical protein
MGIWCTLYKNVSEVIVVIMWGLDGGWEETNKIHSRFCKIILGVPRFVGNNVVELELGRDNMRGKVLSMIVKYCYVYYST